MLQQTILTLNTQMHRSDPVIHEGDLPENTSESNDALPTKKQKPKISPWKTHYAVTVASTIIFYFLPCAVIGLVLLIQARVLHSTGHAVEAAQRRKQAKNWTCWTYLIGTILITTALVLAIKYGFINR